MDANGGGCGPAEIQRNHTPAGVRESPAFLSYRSVRIRICTSVD